jgi:hypothetical protein
MLKACSSFLITLKIFMKSKTKGCSVLILLKDCLQSDVNWNATLVVDGYSGSMVGNYLRHLKEKYYPKIDIIFLDQTVGPGVARKLAIIRAIERGCSIILLMTQMTYHIRNG